MISGVKKPLYLIKVTKQVDFYIVQVQITTFMRRLCSERQTGLMYTECTLLQVLTVIINIIRVEINVITVACDMWDKQGFIYTEPFLFEKDVTTG